MTPKTFFNKTSKPNVVLRLRPQQVTCTNVNQKKVAVCPIWKVWVTSDECVACHDGDSEAKRLITQRSIKQGVDRKRKTSSCVFYCEKTSDILFCAKDDKLKKSFMCYRCKHFKTETNNE